MSFRICLYRHPKLIDSIVNDLGKNGDLCERIIFDQDKILSPHGYLSQLFQPKISCEFPRLSRIILVGDYFKDYTQERLRNKTCADIVCISPDTFYHRVRYPINSSDTVIFDTSHTSHSGFHCIRNIARRISAEFIHVSSPSYLSIETQLNRVYLRDKNS